MNLSTRRIVVLAFVLILFSLVARQIEFFDPDFWWHLKTGQHIVETKSIPHQDIFSFTKSGSEWITHEWLSETAMYTVYRAGGWGWLVVLFSTTITLSLWLVFRRCECHPLIAMGATLLGAAAANPVFGVRPQMISFLLVSIYLAILGQYSRTGKGNRLWLLVPLMALWVNLHAAFPVGLALIGLAGAGLLLDGYFARRGFAEIVSQLKPLAMLLAACVLVVPLNPNGLRLFTYPLETLNSAPMQAYILEWASPDFHQAGFQPLALLIIAAVLLLAVSPKRPRPSDLLFLAVFCYGALRSGRHIPFFALVAIPIIAEHGWSLISAGPVGQWLSKSETSTGSKKTVQIVMIAVLALASLKQVTALVKFRPDEAAQKFPVAAVDFLRSNHPTGPLYNSFNWGGYLIWTLPEMPVFIDGRADVYGDRFFDETIHTYRGLENWNLTLDRFGVRTVLIERDGPLASLLRAQAGWKVIYEDQQAIVFAR
jgi:hypothetical protein